MTLRIADELHEALRVQSFEQRTSITGLIVAALTSTIASDVTGLVEKAEARTGDGQTATLILDLADTLRAQSAELAAAQTKLAEAEKVIERGALEIAVGDVLFNVRNYPERAQARLLGTDTTPLRDQIVDAILASHTPPAYADGDAP